MKQNKKKERLQNRIKDYQKMLGRLPVNRQAGYRCPGSTRR